MQVRSLADNISDKATLPSSKLSVLIGNIGSQTTQLARHMSCCLDIGLSGCEEVLGLMRDHSERGSKGDSAGNASEQGPRANISSQASSQRKRPSGAAGTSGQTRADHPKACEARKGRETRDPDSATDEREASSSS